MTIIELKAVLIYMIAILIMSAKLATPDPLRISVVSNKGYDIIILVYDVVSKISRRDSDHIVNFGGVTREVQNFHCFYWVAEVPYF